MAAVLASGPEASLSHRSAGCLWQLLPPSAVVPEVTRPGFFRAQAGIRAHRSPLRRDEVALIARIPVTSVSRTLFDLAALLSRRQLEKALSETEVRRLVDKVSIPDLLERYPRRRGSAVLRAILGEKATMRGITRSELEDLFVAALECTDLPRPRLNADVAVGSRFFEADCLWSEQRLIVELDSSEVHGVDRAFEKDRERDRLLMTEGWRVVRITWRQLRDDSPAVLADLRRLLHL
jgi:very-short-patch-repair endonuclease